MEDFFGKVIEENMSKTANLREALKRKNPQQDIVIEDEFRGKSENPENQIEESPIKMLK